ncbi:ABC transporter ATP-binding protein/permease, partial [bacterium]|nr:ABC transporter ATP-binding protein/permease [bacterium]
ARPYTHWLLLALLLAAFMSGSQILLPYLTKIGIDSYILMKGKLIDLSGFSEERQAVVLETYSDRIISLPDRRFVIQEGVLDPDDRKDFIEKEALRPGNYYLLDLQRYSESGRNRLKKLISQDGQVFLPTVSGEQYVIESDDFDLIPGDIRKVIRKPDQIGIRNIALVYMLILVVSMGFMFMQVYVMAWVGQKIMYDIRMLLFDHIQRLHIQYFNDQPTGRLVTRVSNDVNVLNEVFTSILVEMLKNLLMITGITFVMLSLAPRLALITFCVLPLMIAVTWYFKRKMRDAYREVRKKIALINATLAEHISGIKVIQAFAREVLHYKKFKIVNRQAYHANMRELIIHSSFSPFIVFLENLGIALILFYGGAQIVQNTISLGTLVAFLTYLTMFFGPVRDIAEKFNILQAAMASSERIFQVLDTRIEDSEDEGRKLVRDVSVKGDIEFKNVWFAYNDEDWVLRNVSFSINSGETVALVGSTGSGKTTIVNLLTRFFTIQRGDITVDGRSLNTYDRRFIRKNMAMVLQDVFLFSGDIYRNIRLNNSEISDDEIHRISRYVNADKFINQFEDGFNHSVQEGGATLSQGQRQLLAFARALVMNPALLILDEATANIDSETEQWIQKGLERLLDNRTAIVVAHRLSTIKKADRIIVLHRGEVQEIGNHQELLEKRGIYYKLYQLQFKQQEKAWL